MIIRRFVSRDLVVALQTHVLSRAQPLFALKSCLFVTHNCMMILCLLFMNPGRRQVCNGRKGKNQSNKVRAALPGDYLA